MEKIPLCKALIGDEEISAVNEVLKSGWLTHGLKTTEFEERFAEYINVRHAIAMNSCTSALFLAILGNGISGEVLVPSFTFVASVNAILTAGAKPVFVDINYEDCNVNPDQLETYLTPNTRAIMVVHYAGQCCDMDKISDFSKKHNLIIIEDSAETLGGTFKGRASGSWGIGCYSFFPTKNITTGEGGMLTTQDDDMAQTIRALIGHGIQKSTQQRQREKLPWFREASLAGFNFRMSNILATLGVEQMKRLERMNEARRGHSFYLMDKLSNVDEIDLPMEFENRKHVFQMFTIKVGRYRDELVHYLKKRGVEASVHFDPPVHKQRMYRQYIRCPLPMTEQVANSILTLPMFPEITRNDLDRMIHFLKNFFSNARS